MNFCMAVIVAGLLSNILMNIVFFSKRRVKNPETKIYGYLLIANLISLIIEFFCNYAFLFLDVANYKIYFLIKVYLMLIIAFLLLFTMYMFAISFENYQHIKNKLIYIIFSSFLIISFFIMIKPINFIKNESITYFNGYSLSITFIVATILMVIWCFLLLTHYKRESFKKYLPLFILLILISAFMLVQRYHPEFMLVTFLETYILQIMYFTIENPDISISQELKKVKDEAIAANTAKTNFLTTLSHELRIPLNSIMGFSESIIGENLPAETIEEANDILYASNSLLELVNGILDISNIEANKIGLVNTEYNYRRVLNDIANNAKQKLKLKDNIEFKIEIDDNVPATLYGDYERIKQIIINIINNAIKYTNTGYIELKTSSIINGNICRLIISVEDTGCGIKKEDINNLFNGFKNTSSDSQTFNGAGFGLTVSKKLIEMMGGKIIVQSILGKGSKFIIILDQKIVKVKNISEANITSNIIYDLHDKKVLVVDDNILNLKVASRLLRDYKCEVKLVDSGEKCLELINSGNVYDLILMDIMMPKLNGSETLKQLKANNNFNTPVVALTANAISGMREEYLMAGFDEYLSKPIDKNELKSIIDKYLG